MLTVVLCPHCHQRCRVAAGCIGHCPACHRPFQSPPLALPVAEEGAAPSSSAWWIGALVLGIATLAGLCLALGLVCPRPGSMLPEGEIASRADLLLVAGIFLTTLLLSLAPSLIAAARGHPNLAPIIALNLLLSWTIIGWVLALVWSLTALDSRRTSIL